MQENIPESPRALSNTKYLLLKLSMLLFSRLNLFKETIRNCPDYFGYIEDSLIEQEHQTNILLKFIIRICRNMHHTQVENLVRIKVYVDDIISQTIKILISERLSSDDLYPIEFGTHISYKFKKSYQSFTEILTSLQSLYDLTKPIPVAKSSPRYYGTKGFVTSNLIHSQKLFTIIQMAGYIYKCINDCISQTKLSDIYLGYLMINVWEKQSYSPNCTDGLLLVEEITKEKIIPGSKNKECDLSAGVQAIIILNSSLNIIMEFLRQITASLTSINITIEQKKKILQRNYNNLSRDYKSFMRCYPCILELITDSNQILKQIIEKSDGQLDYSTLSSLAKQKCDIEIDLEYLFHQWNKLEQSCVDTM